MTRISKRVREEACDLLSAAASNSRYAWWCAEHIYGKHNRAQALAQLAVDRMNEHTRYTMLFISEFYAEAECLLRIGWTP